MPQRKEKPSWILVSDSKIHVAHIWPTWVLSAPGGPHVVPTNLVIGGVLHIFDLTKKSETCAWMYTNQSCEGTRIQLWLNILSMRHLRYSDEHWFDKLIFCFRTIAIQSTTIVSVLHNQHGCLAQRAWRHYVCQLIGRTVPLLKPPQSPHCYLGPVDHANPPPHTHTRTYTWPHCKHGLIALIGPLRPYCSQTLWSCSGVSRKKNCSKLALTWKLMY